jgi:hypothetical protein
MQFPLTYILRFATCIALLARSTLAAEIGSPPWRRSTEFKEASFTATVDPRIRIHVNAPLDEKGQPARATRLIVFALPNGNTLEQTLGCRMNPGLDWHYDIQHIAAQTRLLRTLDPNERIVLILAEAPGLSWPSFRRNVPEANAKIAELVDGWRQQFGTSNAKVTLTGHSGGGSFMSGVIEGNKTIPAYIDRIAFLDANYSFDAALHAQKIEEWLKGNSERRFIILCYDDREITLNGKKVVGPDGGTYRATGRTRAALGKVFKLKDTVHEPFHETTGLDGRIHFYTHPNPENKILHTVLVGEMNGLVHIATLGTPLEGKWGTFGGPRAYMKFIQREPTPASDATKAVQPGTPTNESAKKLPTFKSWGLPPRPADAIGGAAFAQQVAPLSLKDREAAILREITSGNFPDFLRTFKRIEVRGRLKLGKDEPEATATIDVMPDYLAVGSDADFVRMPMTPQTAQKIADRFGCVLPTRKFVDAIDAQAELKLAPHPMTEAREAVATFVEHNQIIERQRDGKPLGLLTTGIKKDIVLSPRIFEKPNRLAIYGWRQPDGQPIQPLSIVHGNGYVDYSHGVRLIRDMLDAGGIEFRIEHWLADADRCSFVSDEGPMQPPRYPAE